MKRKYRTIFISDLHLGTPGAQAKLLLQFLKQNDADELYLVGDIIDGWRMKNGISWPQEHSDVLREILKKASKGTKVRYIVGNHDEFLRKWLSWNPRFGRVRINNHREYTALNGKRYLVVHGDMFDALMREELKWIMKLGDVGYGFLIWLNTRLNKLRALFGLPYWSMSKYIKTKAKKAVSFVAKFEERLATYAKDKNYDGVICGHIHSANITEIDGVEYLNTGDWVESCTAIVETHKGVFKLIDWSKQIKNV